MEFTKEQIFELTSKHLEILFQKVCPRKEKSS